MLNRLEEIYGGGPEGISFDEAVENLRPKIDNDATNVSAKNVRNLLAAAHPDRIDEAEGFDSAQDYFGTITSIRNTDSTVTRDRVAKNHAIVGVAHATRNIRSNLDSRHLREIEDRRYTAQIANNAIKPPLEDPKEIDKWKQSQLALIQIRTRASESVRASNLLLKAVSRKGVKVQDDFQAFSVSSQIDEVVEEHKKALEEIMRDDAKGSDWSDIDLLLIDEAQKKLLEVIETVDTLVVITPSILNILLVPLKKLVESLKKPETFDAGAIAINSLIKTLKYNNEFYNNKNF